MIISCPNCSVKYFVNTKDLKQGGRKLKCASCNHVWFYNYSSQSKINKKSNVVNQANSTYKQKKEDYLYKINEENEFPIKNEIVKKRRRIPSFFLFLIFFTTIFSCFFYFKEEVEKKFPKIQKAYLLFNIEPEKNLENLVFENIKKEIDILSDGSEFVKIYGTINNTSDEAYKIPRLSASLLDKNNNQLATWFFYADKEELLPDEKTNFDTKYINNYEKVSDIKIVFFPE